MPNLNCPTQVNSSEDPITIGWIVIPKGVSSRSKGSGTVQVLALTTMALFKQQTFSDRGPFDVAGVVQNWPQWVKKNLRSFEVSIAVDSGAPPLHIEHVLPQGVLDTISTNLWDTFFADVTRPATNVHNAFAAKATPITLRDPVTAFARGAQDIVAHLVTHQMTQLVPTAQALSGHPPGMSAAIDSLFPRAEDYAVTADIHESWQRVLRTEYAALANVFLSPKPTLSELTAARTPQDRSMLSSAEQQLLQNIDAAYRPQLAPTTAGEPDGAMATTVFSANSRNQLLKSIYQLNVAKETDSPLLSKWVGPQKSRDNEWWKLAVAQLVTGLPYKPEVNSIASDEDRYNSAQNRLAMLMAEPGMLSSIGMLFDFEIEVPALAQESQISVQPKWRNVAGFCDSGQACVMGPEGTPLPRAEASASVKLDTRSQAMRGVFDPRGYLRLGADYSKSGPQFMLSDFRVDEALMTLQNGAQTDRNRMPEYSPGANRFTLPPVAIGEIHSHDLILHWIMRPDLAIAQRSQANTLVFLDDLVMGIRPHLGRLCGDRIDWFDLTSRTVSYATLKRARSQADLARDAGFSPLLQSDKRDQSTSSVSEALCNWNGWGIGSRQPNAVAASVFGKEETVTPGSLPPFRFGDQVYMGARLVLRDGSSLKTAQQAAGAFGQSHTGRDPLLSVGSHAGGKQEPFRLLRWERLKAPLVLLAGPMGPPEWWPAEHSTRMVVATGLQNGRSDHRHSRRFIVPGKEEDMYSTWKNGMFEQVKPKESAFANVAMDDKGQFVLVPSAGADGREPAFKRTGLSSGKPRSMPYHPDPLVTRIRIYAARRSFPGSGHWIPVSDRAGKPVLAEFQLYHKRRWPNAREVQVDLHAAERDGHLLFVADHQRSVLDVYLPQGESMVLVVAPLGDLDILDQRHSFGPRRVKAMLAKVGSPTLQAMDEGMLRSLDSGLMQFLANQTMIDIEHVLDRPAQLPLLQLKLDGRGENDTSQLFEASLEFDPSSTGTIEVYGSWVEYEGSLARLIKAHAEGRDGEPPRSFVREAQRYDHHELGSDIIGGDPANNTAVRPLMSKTLPCRHELHDQKHREIVYWARGISSVSGRVDDATRRMVGDSFAWPTLTTGHVDALAELGSQPGPRHHHILASRKPKPPSLMAVLPAFAFRTERTSTAIRRTRTSVLAVHMDCDWFDSGNGELLALVLLGQVDPADRFGDVRERFEKLASFWGADPTRQGGESLARLPDYFTASHLGGAPQVVDYPLDVSGRKGAQMRMALYRPVFCAEEGSWRAEIAVVNPSAVSRPFVRLAFCRYQFHGLPLCQVSEIVVADYAQLSDEREAVIMRDRGNKGLLKVTVFGVSFEGNTQGVQPRMFGWLERRCAHHGGDGESAWVADGEPSEWPRSVREGQACWHGELNTGKVPGRDRLRVAIMEEEHYRRTDRADSHGAITVYFDLVPLDDRD